MGILMGSEFQRAERKNFRLHYFRPTQWEFKFFLVPVSIILKQFKSGVIWL